MGIGDQLYILGMVALDQAADERALAVLRESLRLHWDLGYKRGLVSTLEGVAGVMVAEGRALPLDQAIAEALREDVPF